MTYGKPPLLYDDQLALIIGRQLHCPDPDRAREWLKRIGYYRLSAYFIPFRVVGTDNFQAGTTLNDIVDLYKFDCNLRLLTLQALDRIEVAIRAAITYHVAHEIGIFGYADPSNFNPRYDHARLMSTIQQEECKSTEVFVDHYRATYTSEPHLPVWMATELLTFGALSKMYANLTRRLRKKIAREFGQPADVFVSWLHCLAAIRNICAHHSRLWNRELAVKPALPHRWKALGIDNSRFYVVALIIQTLLAVTSPNSRWKERLKAHFDAYPTINLTAMRFPTDWQQLSPWSNVPEPEIS